MFSVDVAPYVPYDSGAPRLNSPSVFGASPEKVFLYALPVTGERPIEFKLEGELPGGLTFDAKRGLITGSARAEGEWTVAITATNRLGSDTKSLRLSIHPWGAGITPLMGWCSWNAFGSAVAQDDIARTADLLVSTGLSSFGYNFVNIDSAWQGNYDDEHRAVMPNAKFPDMKRLCEHIHSLGLKAGIYSTPMKLAWGGGVLPGCTTGWLDPAYSMTPFGVGYEHREAENVAMWTEWGFDYLKYDWTPCDPKNADLMRQCLIKSERDFMYCCTVYAGIEHADYWKNNLHFWRDSADSKDIWENVVEHRFTSDKWASHVSPGHFYDLDMLELGTICNSGKADKHPSRLTADERLTAFTIRALLPSPLQISCNLALMTDEDMAILCNDEVIAVNQDPLGKAARCAALRMEYGEDYAVKTHTRAYLRELEGGALAAGFFNLSDSEQEIALPLQGEYRARDLWAKRDLPNARGNLTLTLPPHCARLIKLEK